MVVPMDRKQGDGKDSSLEQQHNTRVRAAAHIRDVLAKGKVEVSVGRRLAG